MHDYEQYGVCVMWLFKQNSICLHFEQMGQLKPQAIDAVVVTCLGHKMQRAGKSVWMNSSGGHRCSQFSLVSLFWPEVKFIHLPSFPQL